MPRKWEESRSILESIECGRPPSRARLKRQWNLRRGSPPYSSNTKASHHKASSDHSSPGPCEYTPENHKRFPNSQNHGHRVVPSTQVFRRSERPPQSRARRIPPHFFITFVVVYASKPIRYLGSFRQHQRPIHFRRSGLFKAHFRYRGTRRSKPIPNRDGLWVRRICSSHFSRCLCRRKNQVLGDSFQWSHRSRHCRTNFQEHPPIPLEILRRCHHANTQRYFTIDSIPQ